MDYCGRKNIIQLNILFNVSTLLLSTAHFPLGAAWKGRLQVPWDMPSVPDPTHCVSHNLD